MPKLRCVFENVHCQAGPLLGCPAKSHHGLGRGCWH
jgi:hypothetical protein